MSGTESLADTLRAQTREAVAKKGSAAEAVIAIVELSKNRIREEVERDIARIFTEQWLPKIKEAVENGRYQVIIQLGSPKGSQTEPGVRFAAILEYGKEFLQSQGFHVESREDTYRPADDCPLQTDTDLIISWK